MTDPTPPDPAALTAIVERTARMGLCSQTHHEHLMRDAARALAVRPGSAHCAECGSSEDRGVHVCEGCSAPDHHIFRPARPVGARVEALEVALLAAQFAAHQLARHEGWPKDCTQHQCAGWLALAAPDPATTPVEPWEWTTCGQTHDPVTMGECPYCGWQPTPPAPAGRAEVEP